MRKNLTIIASVSGYRRAEKRNVFGEVELNKNFEPILDFSKIEIQSLIIKDEVLEKRTFILEQELTDDQLNKMIGKIFEFKNAKKYLLKDNYTEEYYELYKANKIGREFDINENIFEVIEN